MHRPRLAMLRQATGDIHAELETLVDRHGYFDSVARYGEYLRRLHLFYRCFDGRLTGATRAIAAEWQVPDRIGWLARDLAALGLVPLPMPPADAGADRPLDDRSSLTGALYVLLGASLGARVLIERTRRLALPASGGQHYLQCVGASTRWKHFVDRLENEPMTSTDTLCRAAVETFTGIRKHLVGAQFQ